MKRYYRWRIIASAMVAFIILLTLVIGGIVLFSFLQMERSTDQTVQALLTPENSGERPFDEPRMPGFLQGDPRQAMFPSAHYEIETDANGHILTCELRGFAEDTDDDIQGYVDQILESGKDNGRIDSYKYGLKETANGGRHIILMNISIQLQMLSSVLFNALIIGFGLLILLFIILLPVSTKAANLILQNTEKQKQFITDAGHELKTPVAVIRSNLDVMELLEGKSKWSGNIRGQVDRLEGLIKQLLMLARLDEKQWTGKTERIDLSRLTENEMETYREGALQKALDLECSVTPGLCVVGDKDAMKQMIHALMDNAIQYTPDGGNVRVKLGREKKQLCLDIVNTVDALPQIPADRLTDRFVRGDTDRSRKTGGTGIGLSTAKSVVEMHHGSLSINYPDDSRFQIVIRIPTVG